MRFPCPGGGGSASDEVASRGGVSFCEGVHPTPTAFASLKQSTLPSRAGLSLLAEQADQKAVVPCRGVDFRASGQFGGVGLEAVEGRSAENCEVLWCRILPGRAGLFVPFLMDTPLRVSFGELAG